jgi:hypothetical protein
MVVASYQVVRRGVLLFIVGSTPFAALVVALIALTKMKGGAIIVVFVILVVAIGVFNIYFFGFHAISRVDLMPGKLRWQHALGRSEAPVGDVRAIRCEKKSGRGGPFDAVTVEFAHRRPLTFNAAHPGLAEFLGKVHDVAPQATMEAPVG